MMTAKMTVAGNNIETIIMSERLLDETSFGGRKFHHEKTVYCPFLIFTDERSQDTLTLLISV